MKFELEKRALLEPKAVAKISRLLAKVAKKKEIIKRFSIIFWDHAEVEPKTTTPYDFRVRITGKTGLFTLKYGDWRGGAREEYEFHFDVSELSSVVNLMRVLGHKWGTVTHVERQKYLYKGMEIVLDRYLDDGKGILEIEKECRSKKEFGLAEMQIDEIFKEWRIEPITKEGMVEFVRYTNNKKQNYFDLAKNSVESVVRHWMGRIKN